MPATEETRGVHRAILELLERARLHRSCVTCANFDLEKEVCGLCDLRPPATTIASGCDKYEEEPPF